MQAGYAMNTATYKPHIEDYHITIELSCFMRMLYAKSDFYYPRNNPYKIISLHKRYNVSQNNLIGDSKEY